MIIKNIEILKTKETLESMKNSMALELNKIAQQQMAKTSIRGSLLSSDTDMNITYSKSASAEKKVIGKPILRVFCNLQTTRCKAVPEEKIPPFLNHESV